MAAELMFECRVVAINCWVINDEYSHVIIQLIAVWQLLKIYHVHSASSGGSWCRCVSFLNEDGVLEFEESDAALVVPDGGSFESLVSYLFSYIVGRLMALPGFHGSENGFFIAETSKEDHSDEFSASPIVARKLIVVVRRFNCPIVSFAVGDETGGLWLHCTNEWDVLFNPSWGATIIFDCKFITKASSLGYWAGKPLEAVNLLRFLDLRLTIIHHQPLITDVQTSS